MADGNVKAWETDRYKNKYSYKAALAAGIIAFLLLAVSAALAQDITGTWLTAKKDSKIMIYRNPDKTYSGKIVWAASTDRQFEGLEILRGVVYDSSGRKYICPRIYNPKLNITARAVITLEGDDIMHARITKGIISVREIFTRVQE